MNNELQQSLAFGTVLCLAVGGVALLIAAQEAKASRPLSRAVQTASKPWLFTLDDMGGFSWWRLVLASVLSLFLEMLMIRWMSSEVPVFAYLKNVVLIGCFLGFGLGYCICRRSVNLLALGLPLCLLVLLVKLPWPAMRSVMETVPYLIARLSELEFLTRGTAATSWLGSMAAILTIALLFALVAFTFIPLGQIVGRSLEIAPNGVLAYTVNILAGVIGIILYSLLCFLYQPPAVWFALSGAMLTVLVWSIPRWRWTSAVVFLFCIAFVSLKPPKPSVELWSPYQKITLMPIPSERPAIYQLHTNSAWYQEIIDLSPRFVATHPELFRSVPVEGNAYNIPYRFYPAPPSVLVLGAGTGNDVAAAVRNGAGRIVAVEIDPLILELGRRLHFERPYDSPRVKTVLDDARSYVQNSRDQFDVIVFSLLDSHTTASSYSNIRIDNYVYTLEAFRAAKRLLKPDGVFIVKFWVNTPWIAERLYNLMTTVFGQPPVDMNAVQIQFATPGRVFLAGGQERIRRAPQDPKIRAYLIPNPSTKTQETTTVTTDDWPYFYQRKRGIPLSLITLAIFLLVFWRSSLKRTGVTLTSMHWHFFFLGAGFMLLESQIVSKMALLFGTTWLVNAVVVSGLLLLIAAANVVAQRIPYISSRLAYAGIFCCLVIGYSVPLQRLFFSTTWVKALAATVTLCSPAFFAGIVFIRSFESVGFEGRALGANLFGGLAGGLLELMSLWTGIRSLVLLAAVLYVASYLIGRRIMERSRGREPLPAFT